jgi:hypothetical protein
MAVAGLASACGPLPPQAPFDMAKRLDSSTSGIATACGDAYQVQAFGGDRAPQLTRLDTIAAASARKLAGVEQHNPDWIYQGQTVAEIVHDSIVYLRACHLPRVAGLLTTRGR